MYLTCRVCKKIKLPEEYEYRKDTGKHRTECKDCRVTVKRMKRKGEPNIKDTGLFFTDPHMPFHHPDMIPFLSSVDDVYKPKWFVCGGDEVDNHWGNFHQIDPSVPNPDAELEMAREAMAELTGRFPNVQAVISNHGDLALRKCIKGNFPSQLTPTYHEITQAPDTWTWQEKVRIGNVLFEHGDKTTSANPFLHAQNMSLFLGEPVNVMMGHNHSRFELVMNRFGYDNIWGAYGGCLINLTLPAFKYWRSKPVALGCVVFLDGMPKHIPMRLDLHNRWTGDL